MDSTRSRIQWTSQLDVTAETTVVRKTSIICTIGPKTNSITMIQALRKAGMNIVRLNFSHGTHEVRIDYWSGYLNGLMMSGCICVFGAVVVSRVGD